MESRMTFADLVEETGTSPEAMERILTDYGLEIPPDGHSFPEGSLDRFLSLLREAMRLSNSHPAPPPIEIPPLSREFDCAWIGEQLLDTQFETSPEVPRKPILPDVYQVHLEQLDQGLEEAGEPPIGFRKSSPDFVRYLRQGSTFKYATSFECVTAMKREASTYLRKSLGGRSWTSRLFTVHHQAWGFMVSSLEEVDFWDAPSTDGCVTICDGCVRVLEASLAGRYHFAKFSEGTNPKLISFCQALERAIPD